MYKFTLTLFLSVFSFSLIAQEWVRQNPNVPIHQMYDVAVDPSGTGIAVGTGGVVFITDNFGAEWEDKSFETEWALYVTEIAVQSNSTAYLILSNNSFFISTNGAENWQFSPHSIGFPVYLKAFGDTYLAGGNEGLMRSTDGGQNWTAIGPEVAETLWRSYSFINAQEGWASNGDGDIYHTTDGGQSWTAQVTEQWDEIVALAFLDENIGYAGVRRILAKTTDGGETWTEMLPEAFGGHIDDIAIIDADRAVFTQGNRTFYTHDGGQSVELIIPTSYPYIHRNAAALPDGQVWVTGTYGVVAYSDDAGLSYEDQIPGKKNFLAGIDFLDNQMGWANGRGATVLRTTNGGDDWQDVSPDNPAWESADAGLAISATEFWIGGSGFIARTTDAGQSWTQLLDDAGLKSALVKAGDVILSCDYGGKVHRSTDQGASWETTQLVEFNRLEAMYFTDEQTGYVVGWDGYAAKTTDAGVTWTPLNVPSDDRLHQVFFLSEDEGWVLSDGFSDEAYYTADGGQNWEVKTVPSTILHHIYFDDSMHGYALGGSAGSGRVYETMDGGASWEQIYRADQAIFGFDIQESSDAIRIWIAGAGGMIEKGTAFILGSRDQVTFEDLTVQPNPTDGIVHLELPMGHSPNAIVKIYDADGRCLLQQPVRSTISLTTLPAGWYHLQIIDAQKIYQASLIKELD